MPNTKIIWVGSAEGNWWSEFIFYRRSFDTLAKCFPQRKPYGQTAAFVSRSKEVCNKRNNMNAKNLCKRTRPLHGHSGETMFVKAMSFFHTLKGHWKRVNLRVDYMKSGREFIYVKWISRIETKSCLWKSNYLFTTWWVERKC